MIARVDQLGADDGQRATGGNFKYSKDSIEQLDDTSVESMSTNGSGSDASTSEPTENEITIDETTDMDPQEAPEEANEVREESVESTSDSESMGDLSLDKVNEGTEETTNTITSDRVLRPRTKRIDYSMYHKYEDAQLLKT